MDSISAPHLAGCLPLLLPAWSELHLVLVAHQQGVGCHHWQRRQQYILSTGDALQKVLLLIIKLNSKVSNIFVSVEFPCC